MTTAWQKPVSKNTLNILNNEKEGKQITENAKYYSFFSLLQCYLFPLHFVTQSKMDENSNGSGYYSSVGGKIMLIEAVKTSAADLASVWTCFPDEKANILLRGKEVKRKCSFFFLF